MTWIVSRLLRFSWCFASSVLGICSSWHEIWIDIDDWVGVCISCEQVAIDHDDDEGNHSLASSCQIGQGEAVDEQEDSKMVIDGGFVWLVLDVLVLLKV